MSSRISKDLMNCHVMPAEISSKREQGVPIRFIFIAILGWTLTTTVVAESEVGLASVGITPAVG